MIAQFVPVGPLASLMNLAGPDLVVVLLIIVVLFGAKKLPALARGMGQSVREFQKAKDDFQQELNPPAGLRVGADDVRRDEAIRRQTDVSAPPIGAGGKSTV